MIALRGKKERRKIKRNKKERKKENNKIRKMEKTTL